MTEKEGYNQDKDFSKEATEAQEYGRLLDDTNVLRGQIENGISTDPQALDSYLVATTRFYHWSAQHPVRYPFPSTQEEDAESFLKYQKILDGTYQKEKAAFCIEEAQTHKETAEHYEKADEKVFYDGETKKALKEHAFNQEQIMSARESAANWLDIGAAC